jgi:sulfatase modifying factor 1
MRICKCMSTVMAGAETLVDPTLWRQVVRLTLILFTASHFVVVGPSPAAAQTETATGLSVPLDTHVNVELIWVAPGTFLQGSPEGELGREPDEIQHRVTISRGFYIGKYPITIEQFQSFVDQTGYKTEAERGTSGGFGWNGQDLVQSPEFNWRNPGYPSSKSHPVTIITLEDAQAFCKWISSKSKIKVQLPTESQWEFACRAGGQERTYAGDTDENIDEIAWTKVNSLGAQAVGGKRPNSLGIFDMCGNVSEWCLDIYGRYPATDQTDPVATKPDAGEKPRNVLRGGSWNRDRRRARSAARFRSDARSRNADIGFRVVVMRPGNQPDVAELDAHEFDGVADTIAEPVSQHATNRPQAPLDGDVGGSMEPASYPAGRPNTSFIGDLWGLLCCFAMPAVPGIGIFYLISMLRKNASGPSSSSSGSTRIGTPTPLARGSGSAFATGAAIGALGELMDPRCQSFPQGFWFDTTGIKPGSVVRIQYEIDGRIDQYQFEVENMDRQRVFLGGKPTKVTVLGITPPDGDDWRDDGESIFPNQPPMTDSFSRDMQFGNSSDREEPRSSQGSGSLFGGSRFPSAY